MTLNKKVWGLIAYINDLSQLRQKPVYSYRNYKDLLWVADIPKAKECENKFKNETDELLYIRKPVFPKTPTIPKALIEWGRGNTESLSEGTPDKRE